MKHFWYSIAGDELKALIGEVDTIPSDFIELHSNMGADRVYYRIKNGKITDAIGEGIHEAAAHRRVEDFISSLNASLV